MASEIASAYVRIRPNLTGFKSETEHGVKSSFSNVGGIGRTAGRSFGSGFQKESETGITHVAKSLAKLAGVAYGAMEALRFGKDVIGDAATLQKSVETVNAEFGKGAKQIHAFADEAGIGLGITSHLTESTAARFGILFKNLGIGGQQAGAMTVGFLKLAGSLAAIRGIDPATVLERLPLAVAGNLRSLKQLGIAVDANQIKFAALKLGLISTIKGAITPAIRAQAIYALATANLGLFQKQAAAHAGDWANVQRRLSAEWDRAKEILGTALLPIVTKYGTELERWLNRMLKSGQLQADFNRIAHQTATVVRVVAQAVSTGWKIFQTAAGWIGGVKVAAAALLAILAERKIIAIGQSIGKHLSNPITNLKTSFRAAKGESQGAFATMRAGAIATGVTIRTALIETGIGLLIVAVGIAVGYIVTHWDTVKKYTVALAHGLVAIWGGLKTTLLGLAEEIGGGMATALTLPLREFLELAGSITKKLSGISLFGFHPFGGANDLVQGALSGLKAGTTTLVSKGAKNVEKGLHDIGSSFGKAWTTSLAKAGNDPTTRTAIKKFGTAAADSVTTGIATSVTKAPAAITKAMRAATALAIAQANKAIVSSVVSADKNLDSLGQKLAARVNTILGKLGLLGGAIAGSPQAVAFKKLQALIASGAPSFKIARASQELSSDLSGVARSTADVQKEKIKAQFAQLTSQFDKGKINESTLRKRVEGILATNHITAANASKVLGKDFASGLQGNIKALFDQAHAIAVTPEKFRKQANAQSEGGVFKIVRPLEEIHRQQARLALRAEKQRDRIAKAAEKTAASSAKTAAALTGVHVGKLPGKDGKASKHARTAAAAGVQP